MRFWRSQTWQEAAQGLALSPEEGYVLSLLESPVEFDALVALSALPSARVRAMLELFRDKRLVESERASEPSFTVQDFELPAAMQKAAPPPQFDDDDDDEPTIEKPSSRRKPIVGGNVPFDALADLVADVPPALRALATPHAAFPRLAVPTPAQPMQPAQPTEEERKKRQEELLARDAEEQARVAQARAIAEKREAARRRAEETQRAEEEARRAEDERPVLPPIPMLQAYSVFINETASDETRASARDWMRNEFTAASPDDRARFLLETEAHTLPALTGIPFDARVTTILCTKTYASQLLVQNLVKHPGCPGPLLKHLLRQTVVRQSQALKRSILNHPNVPTDLRKKG